MSKLSTLVTARNLQGILNDTSAFSKSFRLIEANVGEDSRKAYNR